MKIVILFFLLIFSGYAKDLKNHQSLILASFPSFLDAKTFIKNKLEHSKKPIFIIKSKRGFFIVTLGIYNTKEEVYKARDSLNQKMKSFHPFRGNFDYDLTKKNESILYRSSTKSTIQKTDYYIDSISLGIGKTAKKKNVYKISVQKNFKEKISLSDSLKFNGYFDFTLTKFDYNEKNIYSVSFTPVFKYMFSKKHHYAPYLFAGVGVSYFSDTIVDNKDISTHFQFDDRLGVGFEKDNLDFQLGYFHNSNASIKKPNDGIDMILFNILYRY